MAWTDDNKWESDWWGNCTNTYSEETKQLVYASKMGLKAEMDNGKYPSFDMQGKSILDIGGGPVSLLLKCKNFKNGYVIDPCDYPEWVHDRYKIAKIDYWQIPAEAEELKHLIPYDEVWIYNVLQHVQDPEKVIANARDIAKVIRIFEWVDMPPVVGHPHELTEAKLNKWLGGEGKVEQLDEDGCRGKAYYGLFKGKLYE